MIPEEMQRTIQFLLDNQAAHDARLAQIEVKLDKLTDNTLALAKNHQELATTQREMQEDMRAIFGRMETMQSEFQEGLERIVAISERTYAAVRQVAEAEVQTKRRVGVLEDRVDVLENPSE